MSAPLNKFLPSRVRSIRSSLYDYGRSDTAHFAIVVAEISILLGIFTGVFLGGAAFIWSVWTYYHPYDDGSLRKTLNENKESIILGIGDSLKRGAIPYQWPNPGTFPLGQRMSVPTQVEAIELKHRNGPSVFSKSTAIFVATSTLGRADIAERFREKIISSLAEAGFSKIVFKRSDADVVASFIVQDDGDPFYDHDIKNQSCPKIDFRLQWIRSGEFVIPPQPENLCRNDPHVKNSSYDPGLNAMNLAFRSIVEDIITQFHSAAK